jgi:hypothetical protein
MVLGGKFMFQNVNGVQIREHKETKEMPNLIDKRFEIEYQDDDFTHKLVCLDIMIVNVNSERWRTKRFNGYQWMYVINNSDFYEYREMYAEVCKVIQKKIGGYFQKEYGLSPVGEFLIESKDRVYVSS